MRGILINSVVLMVLLGGCRGVMKRGLPQPAALPAAYHVRVDQLMFHSDFELPREHRLVRELTAEREDIGRTLSLPGSEELIDVYLFRDAERYGRYAARHFPGVPSRRAFFLETDTRLAVYAHWSDRVAEDLRHEVAHGYLHALLPGLPLWLDEGLAEFFEVPRGQNGLNRPHLDLLSDMRRHESWLPDLVRLEQLTDAAQMAQLDYAEAWAWVYFLLHSDPERRELLTGYLAEMRARGAVAPLSQWLAKRGVEPERMLGDYLAGLSQGTTLR
jgi:hypothetical protein